MSIIFIFTLYVFWLRTAKAKFLLYFCYILNQNGNSELKLDRHVGPISTFVQSVPKNILILNDSSLMYFDKKHLKMIDDEWIQQRQIDQSVYFVPSQSLDLNDTFHRLLDEDTVVQVREIILTLFFRWNEISGNLVIILIVY